VVSFVLIWHSQSSNVFINHRTDNFFIFIDCRSSILLIEIWKSMHRDSQKQLWFWIRRLFDPFTNYIYEGLRRLVDSLIFEVAKTILFLGIIVFVSQNEQEHSKSVTTWMNNKKWGCLQNDLIINFVLRVLEFPTALRTG